jgi:hypothetical protein
MTKIMDIVDFRIIHFENIFIPNLKRSLKVSRIRHKLNELGKYFVFRPGGYDPPSCQCFGTDTVY